MSEFSVNQRPQFERLSFKNVKLLIDIFQNIKLNQTNFVQTIYLESASHFFETAQFLDALKITSLKQEKIQQGPNYLQVLAELEKGKDRFLAHLINLILESKSLYAKELKEFITRFKPSSNGELVLQRSMQDEYLYAVRNFLIEAGAVDLSHYTGTYTLGRCLEEIYPKVRYCVGMSPAEFENTQLGQTKLGLLAEKKVVTYEKSQVDDMFKHHVIHVAKFNVAAGFDVHSVRSKRGKISQWRYIEVKAVSPIDWRFYWTKNERQVAELYKESYFIYLVPVEGKTVSIDQLVIIPDPINNLLNIHSEWEISTNIIECKKRQ